MSQNHIPKIYQFYVNANGTCVIKTAYLKAINFMYTPMTLKCHKTIYLTFINFRYMPMALT